MLCVVRHVNKYFCVLETWKLQKVQTFVIFHRATAKSTRYNVDPTLHTEKAYDFKQVQIYFLSDSSYFIYEANDLFTHLLIPLSVSERQKEKTYFFGLNGRASTKL